MDLDKLQDELNQATRELEQEIPTWPHGDMRTQGYKLVLKIISANKALAKLRTMD